MSLVNGKKILKHAQMNKYALGAFNFTNLEQLQAILSASNSLNMPVIVQASSSAIKYIGLKTLCAMVKAESEKVNVDVCLNLDHGANFEICKQAIDAGFTNVMIDCSSLPFEENIQNTKEVVEYAHKFKVTVEAELGCLKGKEDEVSNKTSFFTVPNDALKFVKATKVDSLAISIGTSHGAYKFPGESELDIQRLKEIKKLIKIPLVLHGASGISKALKDNFIQSGGEIGNANGVSEKNLVEAIDNGICKVNMDTDLRIAFTTGVRNCLKKATVFNLRDYLTEGKKEVEKIVKEKIILCKNGSK